jgi:hypothetical protein
MLSIDGSQRIARLDPIATAVIFLIKAALQCAVFALVTVSGVLPLQ